MRQSFGRYLSAGAFKTVVRCFVTLFARKDIDDCFQSLLQATQMRVLMGSVPQMTSQEQGSAQRVNLVLAFPDPRAHLGEIVMVAGAVGLGIEGVCVRIHIDIHQLTLEHPTDQLGNLGVITGEMHVRNHLPCGIAQPHRRNVTGQNECAAVVVTLNCRTDGVDETVLKNLANARINALLHGGNDVLHPRRICSSHYALPHLCDDINQYRANTIMNTSYVLHILI